VAQRGRGLAEVGLEGSAQVCLVGEAEVCGADRLARSGDEGAVFSGRANPGSSRAVTSGWSSPIPRDTRSAWWPAPEPRRPSHDVDREKDKWLQSEPVTKANAAEVGICT
jgi:hypothetical protein